MRKTQCGSHIEGTNFDRADWAVYALDSYTRLTYGEPWAELPQEIRKSSMISLITDLLHLANHNFIDPEVVAKQATLDYNLQVE